METKFDIDDEVFVTGSINKIEVEEDGRVMYQLTIESADVLLWIYEDEVLLKKRAGAK